MGFFDRFKKANYRGTTAEELGDDIDEVVRRLALALTNQDPLIQDMGPMVIARSPILTIVSGEVRQPASLLPRSMLTRFWVEPGWECFDDPNLVPLVSGFARALAMDDKLAKHALSDTEDIYVSKEAPTSPWPDQDKRLRLASLVLADCVRKLAANFNASEIKASYGLSESDSARVKLEEMKNEESLWFMEAMQLPES
jgi:hypothetical protein